MSIDTTKVQGRREVHYDSYDQLLADAEQLAAVDVNMVGNWSLGQVFGHLARSLDASIDGYPGTVPWFVRLMTKLFMRKMLLDGPLKPGFKLPADAEKQMVPDVSVEEGLAALRTAIERQKTETNRVPHLALGELSLEDWQRAMLRHAELHMSFAIPAGE